MSSSKRYPKLTPEQRAQRRRDAYERLTEATAALLDSDTWRRWLAARATFHTYSLRNTILIERQCHRRGYPHGPVAGFRAWIKLGRAVRKGERGLEVLAPVAFKVRDEHGDETDETALRFRTMKVFHVCQTDPIPGTEPVPLSPPSGRLEGDSHTHLLAPLDQFATTIGYEVRHRPLKGEDGLCHLDTRLIEIEETLAGNAKVATTVHELAHALHNREVSLAARDEELVVEAVAFIVCAGAGLDTSSESVPYIAAYVGNDAPERLTETLELIDSLAREIEHAIAPSEPTPATTAQDTPATGPVRTAEVVEAG